MPSHIIHVLSGRAALAASLVLPAGHHDAAFNLGCQGPDLFSHNRRTRPFALAYSRLLHRHDYGRFCVHFAEALAENPSPPIESWFYGFVSHQAVDRVFHPYIVNRSFVPGTTGIEGVSPAHLHAFLERILDVCLLEQVGTVALADFDTDRSFNPGPDEVGAIADAIASALVLTYPQEAANDPDIRLRCLNAFKDSVYYYEMTNPVLTSLDRASECSGIERFVELGIAGVALLHPDVSDSPVDWLNEERKPWRHPVSGEYLRSSVSELYEEAVRDATAAIRAAGAVLAGHEAPGTLEALIGNECLSVSGADGRIGTVSHYEPFDLAGVLLDQAQKRKEWLARGVC